MLARKKDKMTSQTIMKSRLVSIVASPLDLLTGELLICFSRQSIVVLANQEGSCVECVNSGGSNRLKDWRIAGQECGKCRQKERALTSPKTSALAFISVLPWRINDGEIVAPYGKP